MTKILSVGGSIIAPDKPDSEFLSSFVLMCIKWLDADSSNRLILVAGGGAPARFYQNAYREVSEKTKLESKNDAADWIGIMATRINAQLLKACFGDYCKNDVVYNPTLEDLSFDGKVLVASGWKPGFSTDTDAVYLGEKFNAKVIVNLSNIEKVFTDDPKKNPDAKPLDTISWQDFRKMVGDEWVPGKNCPFDPIASKKAQENGMKVICAGGKNIDNISAILNDREFFGTTIG
ncbi:MAG: UMP kinase [Treponema sp.]|nr:UMP kinase [Treponema sp.]